ncbi:MAG: hypothetical protein WDO15_27280 [Bacteroidota bacterium]
MIDYLLKPIPFERFLKSVGKVLSSRIESIGASTPVAQDSFIYFKVDKKMVKTKIAEILYIESIKDYVKVRTAEKRSSRNKRSAISTRVFRARTSFAFTGHSL